MPTDLQGWIVTIVTPSLVVWVGYLLKRAIDRLDKDLASLSTKTEKALEKGAQHDTRHAVTESRMSQQDARMSKMEGDIAMLHGRVSRLISDKLDRRSPESKEE